MRAFITAPTLQAHGGIRVLLEWANRLPSAVVRVPKLMDVHWMKVASTVTLTDNDDLLPECDLLIVGSPHGMAYLDDPRSPERRFIFLQMMEELFRLRSPEWTKQCVALYHRPEPLICISKWNEEMLRGSYNRTGAIFRVTNGVNLEDFPIERVKKDGRTVLVENWESRNPTKDMRGIGPEVANRLRFEGFRIVGYGRQKPARMKYVPAEFHVNPSLEELNQLYREATILLKATKLDARACAPMEAMTKGTVTVRAIVRGDDDLNRANSVRVAYDADALYRAAHALLKDDARREKLSERCLAYAESHSWDRVWPSIEKVLR